MKIFTSSISIYGALTIMTLFALSTASEILIIYSNSTEGILSNIITGIKSLNENPIFWYKFIVFEKVISKHPSTAAVFDITNNLQSQFQISKICEANLLPHFVVSNSLPFKSRWTFFLSSSKEDLNKAINSTLAYFNWDDGIAIADVERHSMFNDIILQYPKIDLFSIDSDTYIQEFVCREIARLGSSLFFLFLDKELSLELQESLASSKLLESGTGLLLIGDSSYKSNIDGALAIVEKGRELVDSKEKYIIVAISEMISFLNNSQSINLLLEICPNNYCVTEFSLVNVQRNDRKIVGSIKRNNIIINSSVVFPGNTTETPISHKKILQFSASNGSTDPGGSPQTLQPIYARGITLAVKHINSGTSILEHFNLQLNGFDCGVNRYDTDFSLACFKKDIDKLGLAHISGLSSAVAIGEMATFKALNVTIPVVGATNSGTLSNSTEYPYYTRVNLSSVGLYGQMPLLLKSMGWSSIAVIYQNDGVGSLINYYVSQAAEEQNIQILNTKKAIPAAMTREQLKNWTDVFQEVIDLHVRLVFLTLNPPLCNYAVELFYDLGVRKGDIFIYSCYADHVNSIATPDDYLYKRLEVGIPLFTTWQTAFVGSKGKAIYDELSTTYNTPPASFSCPLYDAAYLIGTALDWSIDRGLNYNDPSVLEQSIRDVKFIGCTGTVYIQKGSNDRLPSSITILANSYTPETGLTVYTVGYLKPYSSEILTIVNPIVYADGTTNRPSDILVTRTNCPFDDKFKQTFTQGRVLAFGICFSIAAATAGITYIIWKKWWNFGVEELIEKQEISVPDFIVGISIVVEFFQLISIGPDVRPLNPILANMGDFVSLNVGYFISLENGVFWWLANVVIGLSWLWALLCTEVLLQLHERYENIGIFEFLAFLTDNLMPILGNLCFIPFISILLDVFVCDESIGDSFTESYLAKDCYQFCWQGSHITYVVLSSLSLAVYEPLAVFCRPLWQELQSNLHVKSMPSYLMVKTVIQVLLVVMNKTLKRSNEIAYGFAFTLVIALYVVFIAKFKAYNYPRFNWWLQLSLIGVAWMAILSTANAFDGNANFPYISLIICGGVLGAAVGLAVQRKKYPSLLIRKRGKDTSTLFRFAFTFGKESKILRSKITPAKLDLIK